MKIILKEEYNQDDELEVTVIRFKGKYQTPLIMVIRECWHEGCLVFAKVIWRTRW